LAAFAVRKPSHARGEVTATCVGLGHNHNQNAVPTTRTLLEQHTIDYIPLPNGAAVWHLWPVWFMGDAHSRRLPSA
jgi:hypothetical protein